jgi:hypothetical protein
MNHHALFYFVKQRQAEFLGQADVRRQITQARQAVLVQAEAVQNGNPQKVHPFAVTK